MTNAILKNGYATTAGTIVAYNFDAVTGEYTGNSDEFLPVGVGLPAYSTEKAPPDPKAGFAVVFSQGGWRYVADHRGETVYSTATGKPVNIDSPGEIAEGFTPVKPSTPFDKWDGTNWVTDTDTQHIAAVEAAEIQRQILINAAMASVSVIQLKLQAGRKLTQEETAKLSAVLDYTDEVTAIDTDTAPHINWPDPPDE